MKLSITLFIIYYYIHNTNNLFNVSNNVSINVYGGQ
jgi:hypothetical protein